ncbi:MAG: flagellar biosynthesis protein FliQ [Clostridiaceae bacterium]|nr:flagellar biosynthesis protein FliQ [Clostridiaceae bacterium]
MDMGTVLNVSQQALLIIIYVSAPILGVSLLVGLAVSIFQATTQIHEQTLSFVPKIIAVIISVLLFGSWMLVKLMEFTKNLFLNMNEYFR